MTTPTLRYEQHEPLAHATASGRPYALVHLVAQEMHKGLIETQVLDHMESQATQRGPHPPRRVAVAFLEPVRVALRRTTRHRLQSLRRRAPHVHVTVLPYVSRVGLRANARVLSIPLRMSHRGRPTVFHCRSEIAVRWAAAFREWIPSAAIVADFRGVWPEEYLHAQGIDALDQANEPTRLAYERAVSDVKYALSVADGILTVSTGLRDWLGRYGSRGELTTVVPTCVSALTFAETDRRAVRDRLGVSGKVVLAYAGTVTRYQHLREGFAAFARIALEQLRDDRIHVLCVTPDVDAMRRVLTEVGVPAQAATVVSVPQEGVAAYLSAADAGFLLRADSVVNRVSVPVKLGEYLAAGVPVVISRVDGWLHETIATASAGWSIDWFGLGDAERRRVVADVLRDLTTGPSRRESALALCRTHFLWSAHTRLVRGAYQAALTRAEARSHTAVEGVPTA